MKRPDAPKPPVIPQCSLIHEGTPYLYCRYSDGSAQRWRWPITQETSNAFQCTSNKGYLDAWEYGKKLDAYVEYKLKECERKNK